MYEKSADIYDPLHDFKDYGAEAANVHGRIQRQNPRARKLLDVACGTGRHLEHLSAWYDVSGVDISRELLAVARGRCRGIPLYEADMSDFALGETYDVITCLFSSIASVRTEERLRAALRSMRSHLRPNGAILIEPWFTPESLWTGTITANFADEPGRKIAWMYVTDPPRDGVLVIDHHFVVGEPSGIRHFTERQELGVFTDEQYRSAFEQAGLGVEHDSQGPTGRGLYVGTARGS